MGRVLNNHDECFAELHKRFQRFGEVLETGFERHISYGYINMTFESENEFTKLRASFNRVKFKGNMLSVSEAKMDWKQRWKLENADHEREKLKKKQILKQQWEHYKKLENINMSWKDRKEVVQGRERTKERSKYKARHLTFRVNVNGKIKIYKCYKTKLWGYERNKNVRDLVYKFVDNYWKSGTEHVVDKLDYSRSKVVHFRNKAGNKLSMLYEDSEENKNSAVTEDEKDKNNALLSSVLGTFDFDKPMLIENDQEEEYGGEDYEYQAIYQKDDESRPNKAQKGKEQRAIEDSDDGNMKTSTEDAPESNTSDSEEEFIPTFGAPEESSTAPTTTNKLRDLLNPSEETTFKLIEESDDDIDHRKDVPEDLTTPLILEPLKTGVPKSNMLFFPHFDSPFLVGQTRLTKIKPSSSLDEKFSNWEETFWANRSTWTRDMKQRKRDALRQRRKKANLRGNSLLL